MVAMDQEKEKYHDLLQSYTEMEKSFTALKLTNEAKDEECMTLHSLSTIQKTQINKLQDEITEMLDKIDNIRGQYEIELEQRE